MTNDLIRKILELCDHVADARSVTLRTLAADIRAELEPVQEEAPPPPWTWDGYDLRVNDDLFGSVGTDPKTGAWTARVCLGNARVVADQPTARAVLVAMAGFDPGVTFVLSLRPDWTREDIDAARAWGLGSYVAGMLEGYAEDFDDPQHVDDPEIVRRWWAGGYKALDLVAKEHDDDNPF